METVTERGGGEHLVRNMSSIDSLQQRLQGGDSVPASASILAGPRGDEQQPRNLLLRPPPGPVVGEDHRSAAGSFREDSQVSGSVAKFVTDPGQVKTYFNHQSGRYVDGLGAAPS